MANRRSVVVWQVKLARLLLDDLSLATRWLGLPFWIARKVMAMSAMVFSLLANEYLKTRLGHCGRGVRLYGHFRVTAPDQLHIGDNVHINTGAFIRAEGGVHIGDHTHIARNLMLYSMNHQFEGKRLPYDENSIDKPVLIGRNVWIGANVSVAPGSCIGDGAIIAMGAVVSGQVAPGAIVSAAPLRVIRYRDLEHYRRLDEAEQYGGIAGYPLDSQRRMGRAQRNPS